jgi:phosphonoacetaldehyde hydrolase
MDMFIRNRPYRGPVQGVVLDWAGTAVDYGCLGPAAVFVEVFKKHQIDVSIDEARRFMGLMKKDHIRHMLQLERIRSKWEEAYGRLPGDKDVDALYQDMEPMMVAVIAQHSDPIPGLLDTVAALRQREIKIGSCTGYTRSMMEVLVPEARQKGYAPDSVVCSSDVPAGRPYPWMCYQNAIQLEIYPMEALVKIGDTLSDVEEGLNAGMWTIGLTKSGNELGLSEAQVNELAPDELERRLRSIEQRYQDAGAHDTAEGIWDVTRIIDTINDRLLRGETPSHDWR